MELDFSRQIFKKHSNIKFREYSSSWSRVVPCGWTDRRTDRQKDKHDVANSCYSFVSTPKNGTGQTISQSRRMWMWSNECLQQSVRTCCSLEGDMERAKNLRYWRGPLWPHLRTKKCHLATVTSFFFASLWFRSDTTANYFKTLRYCVVMGLQKSTNFLSVITLWNIRQHGSSAKCVHIPCMLCILFNSAKLRNNNLHLSYLSLNC